MVKLLILALGLMLLLAALQAPPLVNRKEWPELAGFAVMWTLATIFVAIVTLNLPIPNPTEILRPLLQGLYRLIGLKITL